MKSILLTILLISASIHIGKGTNFHSSSILQPRGENTLIIEKIIALNGGSDKSSFEKVIHNILEKIKNFFGIRSKKTYGVRKTSNTEPTKASTSGDRIQKEVASFMKNPPHNCKLSVGTNLRVWIVTLVCPEGTIYAGEKYKLKMIFPKDYPTKPPSVYFLKPCPKHMHVYSNGDICLNLLGKDWRPSMTAESLAVSILSILSNAKEKRLPQDNAMHADNPPGQQQEGWMYHDDKC